MTRKIDIMRLADTPSALTMSKRRAYLTKVKCLCALSLAFVSAPSHSENLAATTGVPKKGLVEGSLAANHSPVANADVVALDKSSTAFNVLANDTDADGDKLNIVEASATFGAVAFTPDGLLGYAQNPGTPRADKITYIVSDGLGGSAIGTVDVLVNQNLASR